MELKKLEWDSEFFETPVYSASLTEVIDIDAIKDQLSNVGSALIYVFITDEQSALHDKLVSSGALFFDTRIVYRKILGKDGYRNVSDQMIIPYQGPATDVLKKLALQAGMYSRFHSDDRLKPYFEGLYENWLVNSLNKKIADEMFVFEEDGCISGFITLILKKDGGWIGLLSVDPLRQNIGVGGRLLKAGEQYLLDHHVSNSFVITQEDNMKACVFYESCGYNILRREFIYHWWI